MTAKATDPANCYVRVPLADGRPAAYVVRRLDGLPVPCLAQPPGLTYAEAMRLWTDAWASIGHHVYLHRQT